MTKLIVVLKILLSTAITVGLLIVISMLTINLLEDKKTESKVEEGKYILTVLADDYEELLRQRREEIIQERERLLSEQGIAATLDEKRAIELQLKELAGEQTHINRSYTTALKEKEANERLL